MVIRESSLAATGNRLGLVGQASLASWRPRFLSSTKMLRDRSGGRPVTIMRENYYMLGRNRQFPYNYHLLI